MIVSMQIINISENGFGIPYQWMRRESIRNQLRISYKTPSTQNLGEGAAAYLTDFEKNCPQLRHHLVMASLQMCLPYRLETSPRQ